MDYQEKLRLAKKALDSGSYDKETIEYIFPELKESEDGRMVKSLKRLVKAYYNVNFPTPEGFEREDMIAWLEKHGEKFIPEDINEAALQYVDTCTVDGEITHDNVTEPYWNNHSMMNAYKAGWIEKQGEQKPDFCHHEVDLSNCSEEYRKAYYDGWNNCNQQHSQLKAEQKPEIKDDVLSRFAFYQYDDDTIYLSSVFVEECNRKHGYGTKILKAAEEVAKTFGISKIRLKVERNTWMEEWYKKNGYEYLSSEGKYDWLEKRVEQKPRPTLTWKHWKDGIGGNGEGKQVFLIKQNGYYSVSSCLSFECDYIELSELDKLLKGEKQREQKVPMIQWKGDNLKDVIEFTGKSPRFQEWFKTWDEYESYVHEHNNIFKLFDNDGNHWEVPIGAWIVKTPDGFNVPSRAIFKHKS